MVEIKVKYFSEDLPELTYVAGGDMGLNEPVCRAGGHPQGGRIPADSLGVALALPSGWAAHIAPAAHLRRYGILQTNSVGVVDNSFRGDNDQWHMQVYAAR